MILAYFEHLDIPKQWQHYWTKYPEGYTMMEALIKWVSQVDKMTDNVNDWNKYLDEFVNTFDKNLQTKVRLTLAELKKDGTLASIINQTVFADINRDLSQKVEKGKPESITWGMLDQSVKQNLTGDKVPMVGENSVSTPNIVDGSVTAAKLGKDYNYRGVINEGDNLNQVTNSGTYITVGWTENQPPDTHTTALLHVLGNDSGTYATQIYQDINGSFFIRTRSMNLGGFTKWKDPFFDPFSLSYANIVNFGDSIFGNPRPPTDLSSRITEKTGATTYNVGFGGCRMGAHYGYWDAFSMYRLSDAITSGDWSLQDKAIKDGTASGVPLSERLPDYFPEHLARLKAIKWGNISHITIGYGTNDWLNDDIGLDSASNKYEVWTYKGALRYSLEKIINKYPHIKLLIIPPIYRNLNNGKDSDSYAQRGLYLTEFVEGAIEVAKEYHVQYVNGYEDMGWNKLNYTMFYDDGTHLNVPGRIRYGEYLSRKLLQL